MASKKKQSKKKKAGRPKGSKDKNPRMPKGLKPLAKEIEKSERAQVRRVALAAFQKTAEIAFQKGEFDPKTTGKGVPMKERIKALKMLMDKGLPDLSEVDVKAEGRVNVNVVVPTSKEEARKMVEENQQKLIEAQAKVE